MNEILKQRIEAASEHFGRSLPKVSVADIITFRRDAFQEGAMFALSNQWISVEEALPPYDEATLVIDKAHLDNGDGGIYFNHRSDSPDVETYDNGFCDLFGDAGEVLYWMPVPKFKEGGEK